MGNGGFGAECGLARLALALALLGPLSRLPEAADGPLDRKLPIHFHQIVYMIDEQLVKRPLLNFNRDFFCHYGDTPSNRGHCELLGTVNSSPLMVSYSYLPSL